MTEKQIYEILNNVSGLIATIGRKHETVTWLIAYYKDDSDYENYFKLHNYVRDEKEYRAMLLTLQHISDMLFKELGLEK